MRTDLVSAWMIHGWLQQNAPDIAWQLTVDDQVKGVVGHFTGLMPDAPLAVTGQHLLARTVINAWNLTNVALLGGGTPSPLSPRPEQLVYYTDGNPEVVAEAVSAGYNAVQVNVTSADDMKKVAGATTAIATGLFHFLPDAAAIMVFNNLSGAGLQMVVFNHGNLGGGEGGASVREQYSKLGVNLFPRSRDQVEALIPSDWRVERFHPQAEVLEDEPLIARHLAGAENVTDVYLVVRV